MLDLAARAGYRGLGLVEPNPAVGAVLWRDGVVLGIGHHRRFGGPHAELDALASATRLGHHPRHATLFVTLEPCAQAGRQPACTDAILRAGIARVVCARRDPHPVFGGGAERLRRAGISVEFSSASVAATRLADPFVMRTTARRPWVIAKWAQTIDGRLATATGESQWISGLRARRRVHRLRARVDVILTGIGTVLADDPRLTARHARRRRRIARRVVIDPQLRLPPHAALVTTAADAPLMVCCAADVLASPQGQQRRTLLADRGAEVVGMPADHGRFSLRALLEHLAQTCEATNVLVEAGPRLLGALLAADLVDELLIHVGPILLADPRARSIDAGAPVAALADATRFELICARRLGDDAELLYRRLPVAEA